MIIGHKKQQEFLKKIINSKKVPHALLFTGPEELGKKTLALKFISSFFGDKLLHHTDFTLVSPVSKQIQIKQIRDLNWKLSLKPVKSSITGAIIDQAHLMTREAQNCFLKTLEEPKGKSLLVLVTEYPKYLLPTIRSRCETIKFYPVKKTEIINYLEKQKVAKQKIKEIVDICLGRPGRAINIFQNPEMLEQRRKKIKELIKISGSPLSLRFKYVKDLAESQDLKETLAIWLFHFRKSLISCDNQAELIKIKDILKAIQETIFLLSTTNVNPRLTLEVLTMKL